MKHWTQEEIETIKEKALQGISYKDIGEMIGRSAKAICLKMQKLGFVFKDFYKKPLLYCENCNKELKTGQYKYCCKSCAAKVNNIKFPKRSKEFKIVKNKRIRVKKQKNECRFCKKPCNRFYCNRQCQKLFQSDFLLKNWQDGLDCGFAGKTKQLKIFIRRFLLHKYNYKCSKCGWDKIHPTTNKVPLEINHIDGDAENCKESNLEVICPNCHSLTPNFRALNKNSSRNRKSGGL